MAVLQQSTFSMLETCYGYDVLYVGRTYNCDYEYHYMDQTSTQ